MEWKTLLTTSCSWCLVLGIYLLFSGSADPGELMAGAAAAATVLFLLKPLRTYFRKPLKMKRIWFVFLLRIPLAMLQETWLLAIALQRRLMGKEATGRFIEHPYPGEEDDEQDAARRIFMTFGVCITPNSYLVHYDRRKRRVLIRQLVGKSLSPVDRLFVELP